jgi:hypothetical protein
VSGSVLKPVRGCGNLTVGLKGEDRKVKLKGVVAGRSKESVLLGNAPTCIAIDRVARIAVRHGWSLPPEVVLRVVTSGGRSGPPFGLSGNFGQGLLADDVSHVFFGDGAAHRLNVLGDNTEGKVP